MAGFGTSTPIIPFFIGDLGIRDPQSVKMYTGLLQSLPAITMMIMAPIWGSLADQYGRKPMLLRAMFGGAVILLLQGLVTDPRQLLILRTIQGMLTGTVGAATVLVAFVSPEEERGYSLGLLQMSIFLGNSIGPLFGGFISDNFGHRWNFFATALLLLSGGLIVTIFATDDFIPPAERKPFTRSLMPDFSPLRGENSKALWTLLAIVAADQVAGSITSPFLPLFIKTISGASARLASDTGLVIAAGAVSSSLAAVLIGKISYRLGYRRTLVFCIGGAALFTLPQAFAISVGQLLFFRLMSSFFIGGPMPSVNALIALKTPREKQGSMYGLRSSVASAGGAIGPAIGSAVAIGFGYGSVFIATGTVLVVAAIAVPLFVRMREKREI
jgi:DHA1 family multidrug resistance protein-like MFS transporter